MTAGQSREPRQRRAKRGPKGPTLKARRHARPSCRVVAGGSPPNHPPATQQPPDQGLFRKFAPDPSSPSTMTPASPSSVSVNSGRRGEPTPQMLSCASRTRCAARARRHQHRLQARRGASLRGSPAHDAGDPAVTRSGDDRPAHPPRSPGPHRAARRLRRAAGAPCGSLTGRWRRTAVTSATRSARGSTTRCRPPLSSSRASPTKCRC